MQFRGRTAILVAFCVGLFVTPAFAAQDSRVLYLGDSFSMGAFGYTMDSRLRDAGFQVYTVVAGGATPYYWLKNYPNISCSIGFWKKTPTTEQRLGYVKAVPKIEDLITEYSPEIVVVQTGVNLYAALRSKRRPKEENVQEVRSLIDQMCRVVSENGAQSYWILPPNSHPERYPADLQRELADLMKGVVSEYNGAVFESQKFTHFTDPYPETDGIHYGPEEAQQWAEKVATDFEVFSNLERTYAARMPSGKPIRAVPVKLPAGPVSESSSHSSSVAVAANNNKTAEEENNTRLRNMLVLKARPVEEPPAAEAEAEAKAEADPAAAKVEEVAQNVGGTEVMPETANGVAGAAEENAPPAAEAPATVAIEDGVWRPDSNAEVELRLKLAEKSEVKHLNDVPYKNAMGVFEYEVMEVSDGEYPHDRIRVAHMVVMERETTAPTRFKIGSTFSLRLVPLAKYPRLQQIYMIDDLRPNFELPIYVCTFE